MIGKFAYVYLVLGLAACAAPWLGWTTTPGYADPAKNAIGSIFALPWSLLSGQVPDGDAKVFTLLLAMGVLINFGALRWIASRAD